jgi:hypothetical protein
MVILYYANFPQIRQLLSFWFNVLHELQTTSAGLSQYYTEIQNRVDDSFWWQNQASFVYSYLNLRNSANETNVAADSWSAFTFSITDSSINPLKSKLV